MTISTRSSVLCALAVAAAGIFAGVGPACTDRRAFLTELVEARQVAAELHVQFAKAAEAGNRAVMADTDDASAEAAGEARAATAKIDAALGRLGPLLRSLGLSAEARELEGFRTRFDEYRRLDTEILPLAVENTNLKAQRLLFGEARTASRAFREAADAAASRGRPASRGAAALAATRAAAAILEIQVVLAPHIAEARDAEMTTLETEMAELHRRVTDALREVRASTGPDAGVHAEAATAALARFDAAVGEIVRLSRRNTNVRSLALSLGRKRVVANQCEERLHALETALQGHAFTATR